ERFPREEGIDEVDGIAQLEEILSLFSVIAGALHRFHVSDAHAAFLKKSRDRQRRHALADTCVRGGDKKYPGRFHFCPCAHTTSKVVVMPNLSLKLFS